MNYPRHRRGTPGIGKDREDFIEKEGMERKVWKGRYGKESMERKAWKGRY